MTNLSRYEGKSVRLKPDVILGQRLANYLDEEQLKSGPEGIVVRALAKDGRVLLEIDLDNVPFPATFPLDAVRFV
jgi:hypothetical protein